jgi:hypothetical protein
MRVTNNEDLEICPLQLGFPEHLNTWSDFNTLSDYTNLENLYRVLTISYSRERKMVNGS